MAGRVLGRIRFFNSCSLHIFVRAGEYFQLLRLEERLVSKQNTIKRELMLPLRRVFMKNEPIGAVQHPLLAWARDFTRDVLAAEETLRANVVGAEDHMRGLRAALRLLDDDDLPSVFSRPIQEIRDSLARAMRAVADQGARIASTCDEIVLAEQVRHMAREVGLGEIQVIDGFASSTRDPAEIFWLPAGHFHFISVADPTLKVLAPLRVREGMRLGVVSDATLSFDSRMAQFHQPTFVLTVRLDTPDKRWWQWRDRREIPLMNTLKLESLTYFLLPDEESLKRAVALIKVHNVSVEHAPSLGL